VAQLAPAARRLVPEHDDRPQPWLLWLLVLGILVLLAGLPLPITDGDPAFYATFAKNMVASGDWLNLNFDKPPLTFWIMSVSFAALGRAEWVLRAWHIALALATVLSTYALARLALPRRTAVLSALVLLTSAQFFYQSLAPQQDVPLTLFVTLAIYWYLRWEREEQPREAIFAWLSIALAVLSKGIIGLALPIMVVGVHLLVNRPRLPRRALLVMTAGAFVFALIAAPWFVVGILRRGHDFANTFFLGGTLGVGRFFHRELFASRITAPRWADAGAYVPFLALGMLPWTGWLWPALSDGWQARRDRNSALWVCTLWVIVVFGFQSLSLGDKVIRYILPLFPPLAVLVAHAVERPAWSRLTAWVSLAAGLLWLAVLLVTLRWRFSAEVERYVPILFAFFPAFIAAFAGYAVAAFRGHLRAGIVLLVVFTLLSYGLPMIWVARHWDQISPWRPLARMVNRLHAPDARMLILRPYSEFADYYILRRVEFVPEDALVRAWHTERVIAIVPEATLSKLAPPRPVIIGRASDGMVLISNFPVATSSSAGRAPSGKGPLEWGTAWGTAGKPVQCRGTS
jgi:4-amino-4-deoxy-L-arabinose transferase-like glycosyltransferase